MGRGGRRLALAFFDSAPAADAAARRVQRRLRSVAAGPVAVVTRGPCGELVIRVTMQDHAGATGLDVVLGAITRALTERVPPKPGPRSARVPALTADDLARLAAELESGQALVVVLDRRRAAERAVVSLTGCGGRAELHRLCERAPREPVAGGSPVGSSLTVS